MLSNEIHTARICQGAYLYKEGKSVFLKGKKAEDMVLAALGEGD